MRELSETHIGNLRTLFNPKPLINVTNQMGDWSKLMISSVAILTERLRANFYTSKEVLPPC